MAPQSRGRTAVTPLHPFNPGEPTTPDERTPRALPLDHPLASSSSADGDEEKDDDDEDDNDNDLKSQYTLDGTPSGESSDSGSDEDADATPFLHHSNSSFLMANAFAPPYYNRPPTPLPASPSLTSLLRPSFSTTTSRPTTPDSSEGDTPNDTEAAVAKSARTATTVPRASPKVPTYEYYGFVLYLLSSLVFLMYLLWSYLPSPFLHQLGIYYYPNRWWSLAIPSFLVMTIVYIYVALASYNTGYLTLPMSSIENIVDETAHVAVIDSKGRIQRKSGQGGVAIGIKDAKDVDWKTLWNEGTDAVIDVPMGGVCEILYG
ncbi:hypothetical protein ABVK25_009393 [Lepraria finkii]|uniref:PIG-P domain-containing protein n=1 Tax=Lepraria finkii TaxID=1340010 RepID=A0ABR4AXA0_9LECA